MKTLEEFIPLALAEAMKPELYVKQELSPATTPELFTDQGNGKPCVSLMLDDGARIDTDLCLINRQNLTLYAIDHRSKPSSISISLKKRVW